MNFRFIIFIILILFTTKVFSYDISCYNYKATNNGETLKVDFKTRLSIDLNNNRVTKIELTTDGNSDRKIVEHNVWVNENKIFYSDKDGEIEYDMNLKNATISFYEYPDLKVYTNNCNHTQKFQTSFNKVYNNYSQETETVSIQQNLSNDELMEKLKYYKMLLEEKLINETDYNNLKKNCYLL